MKILIAVHHFPPKYTAGAEQEAYQDAKRLQALGHEVRVVCIEDIHDGSTGGISWVDSFFDGIPVRRLSYETYSFSNPELYEYDNLLIGEHISNILQEFRPDVFHLVSGYLITGRSILCAKDLGIPTVITLEDLWFLCQRITMLRSNGELSTLPIDPIACVQCLGEQKRRYRILDSLAPGLMRQYWQMQKDQVKTIEDRMTFQLAILNQADLLIGRSEFLSSAYQQAGVDPARFEFLRQGIHPSVFPPVLNRKPATQVLRIGYIGQIAKHKGVHILLEAIKELPGVPLQVMVYGNTQAFPKYTQQLLKIADGDERIKFAGLVQRQDLSQVMLDLDILVVPSLWYENSPNVILEAFANKLPVIASNLGGMAELIQHEANGLLFDTGNAHDLACHIKRISDSPEVLARFRENVPLVKTVDQEVDGLIALYEKTIARHNAFKLIDPEKRFT